MSLPANRLDPAAQANLRGILASSGLTEKAQTRIMNVIGYAASLELAIRDNEDTRNRWSGDNSYDARKARDYGREQVANTRHRLGHRLGRLAEYADSRGAMLTDAVNGLAGLGKTDEQLACEAVATGLAPFLAQRKCAGCSWGSVPYGSHIGLCRSCASYQARCLESMCAGMFPHVARRVAPLLNPEAAPEAFVLDDDDLNMINEAVARAADGTPPDQLGDAIMLHEAAVTEEEREAFTL
jgi:hypothetical protein